MLGLSSGSSSVGSGALGPTNSGGLPNARRRTASGTAGSTSQVTGVLPAESANSTRSLSRPPRLSVRCQCWSPSSEPFSVYGR